MVGMYCMSAGTNSFQVISMTLYLFTDRDIWQNLKSGSVIGRI